MGIAFTARNKKTGVVFVGVRQQSIEKVLAGAKQIALSERQAPTHFEQALQEFGFEAFEWEVLLTHRKKEKLMEKRAKTIAKLQKKGIELYNMKQGQKAQAVAPVSTELEAKTPSMDEQSMVETMAKDVMKDIPSSALQKPKQTVPVLQFSKAGKCLASYASQKEASIATGISQQLINLSCNGKVKTTGGFIFLKQSFVESIGEKALEAEIQKRVTPAGNMKKPEGILYTVTNMQNGMVYVGVSMGKLKSIKRNQLYTAKKESKPRLSILQALKKEGKENFEWKVLFHGKSEEELLHLQERLTSKILEKGVRVYDATVSKPNTTPAPAPTASLEVPKKKVTQVDLAGKVIAEYDSIEEAEEKTGIVKARLHRVCTGQTKRAGQFIFLYTEKLKQKGYLKEEVKKRERAAYKRRNANRVAQYSPTGDFIAEYASIKDAVAVTGIPHHSIKGACSEKTKRASGYVFFFSNKFKTLEETTAEVNRRLSRKPRKTAMKRQTPSALKKAS